MIFPLKSYLLLSDFFFPLIAAILAYGSNHFFSEDDVLIWRVIKVLLTPMLSLFPLESFFPDLN